MGSLNWFLLKTYNYAKSNISTTKLYNKKTVYMDTQINLSWTSVNVKPRTLFKYRCLQVEILKSKKISSILKNTFTAFNRGVKNIYSML